LTIAMDKWFRLAYKAVVNDHLSLLRDLCRIQRAGEDCKKADNRILKKNYKQPGAHPFLSPASQLRSSTIDWKKTPLSIP